MFNLTQEYVLDCFTFDFVSGCVKWKIRPKEHFTTEKGWKIHAKFENKPLLTLGSSGYFTVEINSKSYLVHRIIWLAYYGKFPENLIDHINGNVLDNSIYNLREATSSENCSNKKIQHNNKVGYKGVCYHKKSKKWVAQISINKKRTHLGYFDSPEEASEAYKIQAKITHGAFYYAM